MKNNNRFVNADTNTGTSSELKLSFTKDHMIILVGICKKSTIL